MKSKLKEYLEATSSGSFKLGNVRTTASQLLDIIDMSSADFKRFYADSKSREEAFLVVLKRLNDEVQHWQSRSRYEQKRRDTNRKIIDQEMER